ncbi:response regulator transcription factor [Chloroflexia bacterium SDU3-3]|nr:response regulator transcription factor [Chloroflexia bacterium SDU3-3]
MLHHITPAEERSAVELLSPQERRVLRLIAAGQSNTAIALDLVVSVNTVKVHVKNIYRKLGVASRLEAARAAHDLDILSQ